MWRFALAQSVGSAHEKSEVPCQDRITCEVMGGEGTLIAVVSDGSGSARFSHIGAELAVVTVSTIAQLGVRAHRTDYPEILREAAKTARERLIEEASTLNVPLRDLSCTLVAAIVAPIGGAALQLGDGAVVIADRSTASRCVFWPQKGQYANSTYFLSDDNALSRAQTTVLPDEVLDIALMSDGLEALALHFPSRTAHEPFFKAAFAPIRQAREPGHLATLSKALADFLSSPAVRARSDDDISLLLASRRILEV